MLTKQSKLVLYLIFIVKNICIILAIHQFTMNSLIHNDCDNFNDN